MTQYVPVPSGHPGCSLVLSDLDARRHRLRQELASKIRNGAAADALATCWQEHDAAVAEIGAVYSTFNAIHYSCVTALSVVQLQISEHINRALNDGDHHLGMAVRGVCALESMLPRLHLMATMAPDDALRTLTAVADPVLELKRTLTQGSLEACGAVSNAEHELSDAWRTHAFGTREKLGGHARLSIPGTMRSRLQVLADPRTTVPPGSTFAESAWRQISTTPLGMRLGSLARYGNPEYVGRLLLAEQLILDAPCSLLNASVHGRLRSSLVSQPNAAMPTDGHVPVLELIYATCTHEPNSEADISDAVGQYSSDGLLAAIKARVDQFDAGVLATRDERNNFAVPHINSFFALASALFFMAKLIDADALPTHEVACSYREGQQQFCAIMRCLVGLRKREPVMALAARLLFWLRYAERGEANAGQFWRYRLRTARLLRDVSAFVGARGLWSGTSWTLNLSVVSE